MYVKTQNNTLLNMDRVVCVDILKSINSYHAEIRAKADEFEFEIYSGNIDEVEDAFHTLEEGLVKKAQLISYSEEDI